MSDDFSKPQPFNVEIGAPELADETGGREMPDFPALYPIPETVLIQPETDLYPPVRHGVQGPRLRGRVWKR